MTWIQDKDDGRVSMNQTGTQSRPGDVEQSFQVALEAVLKDGAHAEITCMSRFTGR